MKPQLLFIGLLGIICYITSCGEKDDHLSKNDISTIHYIKTTPGGCNDQLTKNAQPDEERNDTVLINLSNDTLNIFTGFNYICCANFITDCEIQNDSVLISITDNCPEPQDCYCRCDCYYTFDFFFNIISTKIYYLKIVLNDPRLEEERIIMEGLLVNWEDKVGRREETVGRRE